MDRFVASTQRTNTLTTQLKVLAAIYRTAEPIVLSMTKAGSPVSPAILPLPHGGMYTILRVQSGKV
jgi:hypothetical protein